MTRRRPGYARVQFKDPVTLAFRNTGLASILPEYSFVRHLHEINCVDQLKRSYGLF